MAKKKVNFIPAKGKYLIQLQDAPEISPGGILLPDSAKEKPMEGVILAIGPGVKKTALSPPTPVYFLHDLVLFGKYSGTEVTVDNEQYLIVDESDILGKRV